MAKKGTRKPDPVPGPESRSVTLGALSAILTALAFIPFAFAVHSLAEAGKNTPVDLKGFILAPNLVRPEAAERITFFLSLIFLPVALILIHGLLQRKVRDEALPILGSSLAALLVATGAGSLFFEGYSFYAGRAALLREPVLGWAAMTLLFFLLWKLHSPVPWPWKDHLKSAAERGVHWLCLGLIACTFLTSVFGDSDWVVLADHIGPMIHAASQVFGGKVLLADFLHQYGLYPHFLKPLFSLIGLSALTYSATMGTLLAFSFGIQYGFLRSLTRNRLLSGLGFVAMIYFTYYMVKVYYAESFFPHFEPYFQYWPVRILFPSLLLGLSIRYFSKPTIRYYFGISVLAACGCLWNLDSGIPVYLTWFLALVFWDLLGARRNHVSLRTLLPRLLGHLVAGALVLATVILVYLLIMKGLYGKTPNLLAAIAFQRDFYVLGYMMLPMPAIHPWNWILLIYLAGLASCVQAWREGDQSLRKAVIFILTILGLGLFSYYQGRSHDYNFPTPIYPAFLLLILFLDSMVSRGPERRPLELVVTSGSICLFLVLVTSFCLDLKLLANSVYRRGQDIVSGAPPLFQSEYQLLRKHAKPGTEALILSDFSAFFHLASETTFVVPDSFVELYREADYERIEELLRSSKVDKVFLSAAFPSLHPKLQRQRLAETVFKNYHLIDATPDHGLLVFGRN